MATTRKLNMDETLYVTTFYGGRDRGRCYTFTQHRDGVKVTRTFTEDEMFDMLQFNGLVADAECVPDDGVRPEFTKG